MGGYLVKKISVILVFALILAVSSAVMANDWVDGVYEAWSDAGRNSVKYAKVFVEDGELAAVILREYTSRFVEKDWAVYSWEEAREAAQSLPLQFVEAQGPDVDIVTGATSSSDGFKQAVERALIKADPTAMAGRTYFDGTFLGRSYTGSRGYHGVVWVTLENDELVSIDRIERVNADHSFQDVEDYDTRWPLSAARANYMEAAVSAVPGYLDTITGATGATAMWNIAVRDALDNARIR